MSGFSRAASKTGAQFSHDDRATRDSQIHLRRICGAKVKQLEEEFQLSKSGVDKALSRARKADLLSLAHEKVLMQLIPATIVALREAIENGDVMVALEVANQTGLLKMPTSPGEVVEEFEAFRKRVTKQAIDVVVEAGASTGTPALPAPPEAFNVGPNQAGDSLLGELVEGSD